MIQLLFTQQQKVQVHNYWLLKKRRVFSCPLFQAIFRWHAKHDIIFQKLHNMSIVYWKLCHKHRGTFLWKSLYFTLWYSKKFLGTHMCIHCDSLKCNHRLFSCIVYAHIFRVFFLRTQCQQLIDKIDIQGLHTKYVHW